MSAGMVFTAEAEQLEDAWDAAMEMIDMAQWRTRARIISLIRRLQRRSEDGWARVSYITVAARLGISERYAWDLLGKDGSMWKIERVLERGRVGSGSRGTEYRLRPPDAWRVVPWKENDRDRRADRLASALRAPDRGAEEPPNRAGSYGPYRGANQSGSALTYRGERIASSAIQDRGASRAGRTSGSAIGDRGASVENRRPSSMSSGRASSASSVEQQQDDAALELQTAIETKTGRAADGPSLVVRMDRLVRRHDLSLLLAAVESAPADYKPPYVVKHVEAVAAGRIALLGQSGASRSIDDVRRRRDELLAMIAAWSEGGGDPPAEYLHELKGCDELLGEGQA